MGLKNVGYKEKNNLNEGEMNRLCWFRSVLKSFLKALKMAVIF